MKRRLKLVGGVDSGGHGKQTRTRVHARSKPYDRKGRPREGRVRTGNYHQGYDSPVTIRQGMGKNQMRTTRILQYIQQHKPDDYARIAKSFTMKPLTELAQELVDLTPNLSLPLPERTCMEYLEEGVDGQGWRTVHVFNLHRARGAASTRVPGSGHKRNLGEMFYGALSPHASKLGPPGWRKVRNAKIKQISEDMMGEILIWAHLVHHLKLGGSKKLHGRYTTNYMNKAHTSYEKDHAKVFNDLVYAMLESGKGVNLKEGMKYVEKITYDSNGDPHYDMVVLTPEQARMGELVVIFQMIGTSMSYEEVHTIFNSCNRVRSLPDQQARDAAREKEITHMRENAEKYDQSSHYWNTSGPRKKRENFLKKTRSARPRVNCIRDKMVMDLCHYFNLDFSLESCLKKKEEEDGD